MEGDGLLELGELTVPMTDLVIQFHGVAVVEILFLYIRREFLDQIRKKSKILFHLAAPFAAALCSFSLWKHI